MSDDNNGISLTTPSIAVVRTRVSNNHSHADGSTPRPGGKGGERRPEEHLAALGIPQPEERPFVSEDFLRVDRRLAKIKASRHPYLSSMPEIRHLSMVPRPMDRQPLRRLWKQIRGQEQFKKRKKKSEAHLSRGSASTERSSNTGWHQAARRRRLVLAVLVLLQTAVASWSLTNVFPYPWLDGLETAILAIFAILFSWISLGFWTAVVGFWTLWRYTDRFTVTDIPDERDDQPRLRSRTAVLVPVCNEDVDRVFAGVEASYRSVAATRQLGHFDFYVLSDTSEPERRVEEEFAWVQTCRTVQGFGRIFYRHRRNNIKRKSGNIADFLRRWGRNYDYMIVFDADSLMAGETMVRLARIMDRHPEVGIIQTVPTTVGRASLLGRVQQFASRAYGPMFAAGLHFWQLGECAYWGHNAILRVVPFVEHCGLARLPGKPPLGGEILSHDFVEAALMGRAGWEVWLAPDLAGSYEETPPTLLDELRRDRRWCQGNLQHLRLLPGEGIRAGHRAVFSMGVMAYVSALFWSVSLILSTIAIAAESLLPPVYFSYGPSLFPIWPEWHPEWAIALLSTTAVLLFLPKFLSLLLVLKRREARGFGGLIPLCTSIALEMLVSTLLAPIRMWFHGKFVLLTLMGRQIKWGPQRRDDTETAWRDAIRYHGLSTVFAFVWIAAVYWLNPSFCWWLLPIVASLLLSVPLSVYSSRATLGRALRRWRLFVVPEEVAPTEVIERLHASLKQRRKTKWARDGFVRATTDPYVNAVHVGLLRGKSPKSPKTIARNRNLRQSALVQGPASLSRSDRDHLLQDAQSMTALHFDVRQIRDS